MTRPIIPELVEPFESLPPDLRALRKFAILMDEAVPIPGTRKRIGLDAGLGFIPGVGDAVAGLLSGWIVLGALRHRVPLVKVTRMVLNILLDVAIGSIPFLGDVFDLFFEENMANVDMVIRYRNRTLPPRRLSEVAAGAAVVMMILLAMAVVVIGLVAALVLWLIGSRSVF